MSVISEFDFGPSLVDLGDHKNHWQQTNDFPWVSLYDAVVASTAAARYRSTIQRLDLGFIGANQYCFQATEGGGIT